LGIQRALFNAETREERKMSDRLENPDARKTKRDFVGLAGILTIMATVVIPPYVALQILDVAPFTPARLIIPLVWIFYLFPGIQKLTASPRPYHVWRLVFWPLAK
jgi:hypothetical protein